MIGRNIRLLLLSLLLGWEPYVQAELPIPSVEWSERRLQDQHERPVVLGIERRILLFAFERGAGDMAQQVLREQSPNFLAATDWALVMDVSRMPSMITRLVALPALREQPFPIGVVQDGALLADVPRQPGAVTVLLLKRGQITATHYSVDANTLRNLLATVQHQP